MKEEKRTSDIFFQLKKAETEFAKLSVLCSCYPVPDSGRAWWISPPQTPNLVGRVSRIQLVFKNGCIHLQKNLTINKYCNVRNDRIGPQRIWIFQNILSWNKLSRNLNLSRFCESFKSRVIFWITYAWISETFEFSPNLRDLSNRVKVPKIWSSCPDFGRHSKSEHFIYYMLRKVDFGSRGFCFALS